QPGRQTLDEVALYDRALTAQQVSAHRSAGLTAPSPSPSPSSAASATAAPSTSPSSTGSPFVSPVIAAAGDVACDPTDPNYNGGQGTANFCHMQATGSLLSARPYAAVLPLGDAQYTDGTTSKFAASFQSAWGGSKSLMRPVPGNHEYLSNAAQGYYSYFGAQAGDPKQGWYSYDLGSWHVIALNGECGQVGGCGAGSPQESWLRADLAAHPAACTLAYWHEPLFTSSEPNYTAYRPFWDDLYAARADVVLNGHVHNYERFAPQDPSGVADAAGVREFIVGTGGKDLVGFGTPLATSEVRSASAYGALELTLNQGSYSWHFAPEAGQTFTDAGSTACH
ncbi:MAG: hypothetical protein QOJ79_1983, partial [Actinomycetota bacterium]|nr:hypothetical protein [Actinomycetota bacterium]